MLEHSGRKFFLLFPLYCVVKPSSCLKLRLFYKLVQKKRTCFSCLAMALRNSWPITKSMQTFKELKKNMFPLNSNVIAHYLYLRNQLTVTTPQYFNKLPYYKDLKDQLLLDMLSIWTKASLPVLSKTEDESKVERFNR